MAYTLDRMKTIPSTDRRWVCGWQCIYCGSFGINYSTVVAMMRWLRHARWRCAQFTSCDLNSFPQKFITGINLSQIISRSILSRFFTFCLWLLLFAYWRIIMQKANTSNKWCFSNDDEETYISQTSEKKKKQNRKGEWMRSVVFTINNPPIMTAWHYGIRCIRLTLSCMCSQRSAHGWYMQQPWSVQFSWSAATWLIIATLIKLVLVWHVAGSIHHFYLYSYSLQREWNTMSRVASWIDNVHLQNENGSKRCRNNIQRVCEILLVDIDEAYPIDRTSFVRQRNWWCEFSSQSSISWQYKDHVLKLRPLSQNILLAHPRYQ